MRKNLRRRTGDLATLPDTAQVRSDPPAAPRQAEAARDQTDEPSATASRRHRPAWLRMLPEICALALCAVLYSRTGAWDTDVAGPGPAFYPQLLIWLLVVAMLVRIGQHVLAIRRERVGVAEQHEAPVEEGVEFDESAVSNGRLWQVIALSFGYVIATLYLGWVLATFVFVVLFLYLTGKRNLLITVPLGAVLAVGFAYIFVKVVYIALPTGVGVFDVLTVRLLQAIGAL